MSDQRLTDLEIRLAFQEDTLNQLDEVITGLRDQIDTMERRINQLSERLREFEDAAPAAPGQEEPPPHY